MISTVKKIFFVLVLILFISFIFYFYKELKPKQPEEIKITEEKTIEENIEEPSSSVGEIEQKEVKKPNILYEKILLYPEIDYPYIYAYDPESKTIKEINIEDKTYKEFYKKEGIKNISFSNSKTKIIFKKDEDYYLLDTVKDRIEKLPRSTKKAFWYGDDLYVYVLTNEFSYLATFKKSLEPFVDIYILNPEFDVIENGILVYENLKYTYSSPLILINKRGEKTILLENGINLSALSNKKDLIFVSLLEKEWKSYLINSKGIKLKEFNFGTLKEKCTFKTKLVCGVPLNQSITDLTRWYYYKENFNDRLVIFDPIKNELKYFDLDGKFDILQPVITPLGVIFLNRFDNKLYVAPIENLSL